MYWLIKDVLHIKSTSEEWVEQDKQLNSKEQWEDGHKSQLELFLALSTT